MISALFPGQGSQQTGMGKFLFDNFKVAKVTFEEASDAIQLDLKKLCFDGPEEDLQLTFNTQPALITVSIATARVLQEVCPLPYQFTAGHSVGEYAAFVVSKAMSFTDAIKAVRKRGEFMQEAVPVGKGGMLAVMGLSVEQTDFLCEWAEQETDLKPLSAANYNSPGQIVCSGSAKIIEWLQKNFNKEIFSPPPSKVRLIPLKVSAPFHCSMMEPAENKMRYVLEDMVINSAKIPIVQNFTACEEVNAASLRENLIRQISGPVKWMQSIEYMHSKGINKAIEIGNGKVLSGLVKKIAPDFEVYNLNCLEDLKALEELCLT
ncbi:MAG: ACP S-malonyltransferase [Bdellovibrionales bacterium]|nr:ACP S-malonyltransferase [Bdellovibrionales bacterium]